MRVFTSNKVFKRRDYGIASAAAGRVGNTVPVGCFAVRYLLAAAYSWGSQTTRLARSEKKELDWLQGWDFGIRPARDPDSLDPGNVRIRVRVRGLSPVSGPPSPVSSGRGGLAARTP